MKEVSPCWTGLCEPLGDLVFPSWSPCGYQELGGGEYKGRTAFTIIVDRTIQEGSAFGFQGTSPEGTLLTREFKKRLGLARYHSGQGCLVPSLRTWVQSLVPPG